MAAFPSVKYEWSDLSADTSSVVAREPMERGLPKQRRTNSDVVVELSMTAHFHTLAEHAAFEGWFYDDINAGVDFFDFVDPRGGGTVQARIVGGKLERQTFLQPTLEASKRSFKIEYLRSTW